MGYRIIYNGSSGRDLREDFDSLDDVIQWLTDNGSRYDDNLDNVLVIEPAKAVDIRALMNASNVNREKQGS